MIEPAVKQQRYNDYITKYPDTRERELRMTHDICEAEAEIVELKRQLADLEGRP